MSNYEKHSVMEKPKMMHWQDWTKILVYFIAFNAIFALKLSDQTHYLDYLPFRQDSILANDFRTSVAPPLHLRERKMFNFRTNRNIEDLFDNIVWPSRWPYSYDDFRPVDFTRDEVTVTDLQYEYSQSMIESDYVTLIPGIWRLPIRRHFISPKDKLALADHTGNYIRDGAKVLEIFSCYESILPRKRNLGPVIGVGWYQREMECNDALDDFILQDVSVDPFLPLADNYFDIVIVPAMFQLLQRPLDFFREVNRVLKPGGVAVFGVKLSLWSFLVWKQCRYYVETSYEEDVIALGSFFHYAQGFSRPKIFDLNYPEIQPLGKIKDLLFPNPRLDFYSVVQAKKLKSSPHGRNTTRFKEYDRGEIVEGQAFEPRSLINYDTNEYVRTPYY